MDASMIELHGNIVLFDLIQNFETDIVSDRQLDKVVE